MDSSNHASDGQFSTAESTPCSRRVFLGTSAALGLASMGWAAGGLDKDLTSASGGTAVSPSRAGRPLSFLILGGTAFLGPEVVEAALARGHTVTLFNRGKTRPDLFPEIEKLRGDRDPKKDDGLKALEGDRRWDVVVDNSGYFPRMVEASASLLAPRIGQYIFVSSISAFKEAAPPGSDESFPSATLEDPTVESMGEGYRNYGGLKAACEAAAEKACPGRTLNIRPGFIVGPGDPTGRFSYWPLRAREGGEMLAPGEPSDPLQWIDVRDLAEWMVRCAENRTMGVFLATGPDAGGTIGQVVDASIAAAPAAGLPMALRQEGQPAPAPPKAVWVTAGFLQEQGVPIGALPIWIPPMGDGAGFHRWNNAKAKAAGLTFRPLSETVAGINTWIDKQPADRYARLRGGLPREKEAAILKAWAERGA